MDGNAARQQAGSTTAELGIQAVARKTRFAAREGNDSKVGQHHVEEGREDDPEQGVDEFSGRCMLRGCLWTG